MQNLSPTEFGALQTLHVGFGANPVFVSFLFTLDTPKAISSIETPRWTGALT
jgi:hypothetical protein